MIRINDLVIVLPGITGSVLEKDGKEIWAASGKAFLQGLTTHFNSLRDLALGGVEDSQDDDLCDGVRATRLIDDVHIVPGIHKINGYSDLRRLLTQNFQIVQGRLDNNDPANYFEFPYDWRRDNRVSARRLQRFVEERLARWREFSGAKEAKTILIAHSMGGLISRYYLEVLGGWQDCKLLVTFGTPYRGSPAILHTLAYGVKQFGLKIDMLTQLVKSWPSAYQLLPRYPVVNVEDKWLRVTETNVIPNLTPDVAQKGLSFIHEIDAARESNQKNERYHTQGYKIIPVVGTHQRTWQSVWYKDGQVTFSYGAPPIVGDALATGDGTVPRVSAVPLELSNDYRESFHPEKHASLQSNADLLSRLAATLVTTQSNRIDEVKGGDPILEPHQAALSLAVDDLYPTNTPVKLEVELLNVETGGELVVTVKGAETRVARVTANEGVQQIEISPLVVGTYHVELSIIGGKATSVHDVFAVREPL